jgi:hypothetical protein
MVTLDINQPGYGYFRDQLLAYGVEGSVMYCNAWKIHAQQRYRDKQRSRGITQLNVRVLRRRKRRLREFSSLLLDENKTPIEAFRQAYPRSWERLLHQVESLPKGLPIQSNSALSESPTLTPALIKADIAGVRGDEKSPRTSADGNA